MVSLSTIPSCYVIGSRRVIELRVASGEPPSPVTTVQLSNVFVRMSVERQFVRLFYLRVNLFVREIIDSFVD